MDHYVHLELTFPIITLAAFQDLSLGILTGGARSTITAAVTLTTAGGGLPNDFNSVKLAWKHENIDLLTKYEA